MYSPKRIMSVAVAILSAMALSSCGASSETDTPSREDLQDPVDSGASFYDETDSQTSFPVQSEDPKPVYLLSKILQYDSSNNLVDRLTLSFEYDELGRLISFNYPGWKACFFSYNEQGHISKVEHYLGGEIDEICSRYDYEYNEEGLPSKRTYFVKDRYAGQIGGSGTTATYEYDTNGNLIRRVTSSSENPELEIAEYTYDGNILLSKLTKVNDSNDEGYTSEYDEYDSSLGITKKTKYNSEGEAYLYQEWYDTNTMPIVVKDYLDYLWLDDDAMNGFFNLELKEEQAEAVVTSAVSVYSEVEYNTDGQLATATYYKQDGTHTQTSKLEYDEAGNLIRVESFDDQGFSRGYLAYVYIISQ